MPHRCMVLGCPTSTALKIKMHRFTSIPELFQIWINKIGRTDLKDNPGKARNGRICDRHFSERQRFPCHSRNKTNLKKYAVPDKDLPTTVAEEPEPEESEVMVVYDFPNKEASEDCEVIVCGLEDLSSNIKDTQCETILTESENAGHSTPKTSFEETCVPTESVLPSSFETPRRIKDLSRNKFNVLKAVGVSRVSQLTPKARRLYRVSRRVKSISDRIMKREMSCRRRLEMAEKYIAENKFLEGHVNQTTARFIQSQLKLQPKQSRGRRFNLEDKLFALALLKRSPKGYNLLQTTFALPSRKTLLRLLHRVPFHTGINERVMEALSETAKDLTKCQRYCMVLFDEIFLSAGVSYDLKQDRILGFVDTGDERQKKFSDHALVFMARGIFVKWKQPIAYYFTDSSISSGRIAKYLKEVIAKLQEIGLKVVGTVCDQAASNVKAIEMLKNDTRATHLRKIETSASTSSSAQQDRLDGVIGFAVGGEEIIPVFDPPHLMKGIRNNLLKMPAKFSWKRPGQVATWRDVVDLYELDSKDFDYTALPKLTDEHIYADKIKKMKVKMATQVFSQRTSSTMRLLYHQGKEGCLQKTAGDTADFLLFFDKLFDSFNSSTRQLDPGKPLRNALQVNSKHMDFWCNEALGVLESIRFLSGTRECIPPTVKNWIHDIRAVQRIWGSLRSEGFKYLCMRHLNQDPLENFFGCIRSHGIRNVNPTCSGFKDAFLTLVVNNFMSPHSPGANCEKDDSEGALNSLQKFLTADAVEEQQVQLPKCMDPEIGSTEIPSFLHENTRSYVAGFQLKKALQLVHNCQTCTDFVLRKAGDTTNSSCYELIQARKYSRQSRLLEPSIEFLNVYSKLNNIMHMYLPVYCLENSLSNKLILRIEQLVLFPSINCSEHNFWRLFLQYFIKFYIFKWLKNINNIINGKDHRQINDEVKKVALSYYNKCKNKKITVRNIKKLTV